MKVSFLRIGVIVSLTGVLLIIPGFFLPLFIESIPGIPESAHPLYEWQAVTVLRGFPVYDALLKFFAILPLLGTLIVLATSIAALFRASSPRRVLLKRVATVVAGVGLGIQVFLQVFLFLIHSIGYGRIEIASGFVVVPIGFIVSVIGVLLQSFRGTSYSSSQDTSPMKSHDSLTSRDKSGKRCWQSVYANLQREQVSQIAPRCSGPDSQASAGFQPHCLRAEPLMEDS